MDTQRERSGSTRVNHQVFSVAFCVFQCLALNLAHCSEQEGVGGHLEVRRSLGTERKERVFLSESAGKPWKAQGNYWTSGKDKKDGICDQLKRRMSSTSEMEVGCQMAPVYASRPARQVNVKIEIRPQEKVEI